MLIFTNNLRKADVREMCTCVCAVVCVYCSVCICVRCVCVCVYGVMYCGGVVVCVNMEHGMCGTMYVRMCVCGMCAV